MESGTGRAAGGRVGHTGDQGLSQRRELATVRACCVFLSVGEGVVRL